MSKERKRIGMLNFDSQITFGHIMLVISDLENKGYEVDEYPSKGKIEVYRSLNGDSDE